MLSRWIDGFDCRLEGMVIPPLAVLATKMLTSRVVSLSGLMGFMIHQS